ncbi:MAG: CotH kinase family protein [Planctomycetota bacterium]|nr:CotH kinase family protein [Planctomycetota bacterium]
MKRIGICLVALGLLTSCLTAQPFQEPFPIGPGGQGFPPGGQGFPGGPNGPGGFPGGQGFPPGGFSFPGMSQERKILKTYDKNKNKILDLEERKIARAVMVLENNRGGFGGRRPGGMGPQTTGTPGPKVTVEGAKLFPGKDLYDLATLRTLFLDFESPDWEKELEEFHGTDVDVPAKFTFEGDSLKGRVGVHFRGMSSYMGVQAGSKRSFSVSLDLEDSKQRVMGVKTLNLLNSHEDASMMSTVLYSQIANKHLPTPKANFVKVVINGESWGVYVNVEQFNKEFVASRFKPLAGGTKPARWKVRGSPGGGGGLEYLGENPEDYKRRFELKSGNDEKAWKDLINLCKILNQTPVDKLEEAIKPILDVDQLLWFLALDVALINTDGYWIRASDFSIYKDERGVFHIVPHDMNEAFRQPMGPGMGRPPGGRPGMEFPKPGEILSEGLQKELKLSPPQISALANLQKETDERMNKLLDGNQRQQFLNMRNMRPGMPGRTGRTGRHDAHKYQRGGTGPPCWTRRSS